MNNTTDIHNLSTESTTPVPPTPNPASSLQPQASIPPTPPPAKKVKWSKGALIGSVLATILLIGGLTAGVYLSRQKQKLETRADESCDQPHGVGGSCASSSPCGQSEPGYGCAAGLYCFYAESGDVCQEIGHIVQGSANAKVLTLDGDEVSNLSCGQEYIINSGISVTQDTDYGQIWDHRIWINHQGDNSGKERGLIHWTSDGSDLSGAKIQCECGNDGQCRGGGGYASLESGGDYIELTKCTAWTNSNTGPDFGAPNHGVNFFFKPTNKWGTDGPTTDNDISTFGESTFERHDWVNSDLNFNINCAAGPTPTPTSIPTPTPPGSSFQCQQLKIFRGGVEITATQIQQGDVIVFRGFASATNTTVSKLSFTLTKGGVAQTPVEINVKPNTIPYEADYTIAIDTATSYSVTVVPISP